MTMLFASQAKLQLDTQTRISSNDARFMFIVSYKLESH